MIMPLVCKLEMTLLRVFQPLRDTLTLVAMSKKEFSRIAVLQDLQAGLDTHPSSLFGSLRPLVGLVSLEF